jgi:hypothetical protein
MKIEKSKRYKVSIGVFSILTFIGIWGYISNPEHIDKLGMYMLSVVIPVVGYLLSETWRKSDEI